MTGRPEESQLADAKKPSPSATLQRYGKIRLFKERLSQPAPVDVRSLVVVVHRCLTRSHNNKSDRRTYESPAWLPAEPAALLQRDPTTKLATVRVQLAGHAIT